MGVWKYITDMVYYSPSSSTQESSALLNQVPARKEDEEAKDEEQLKEEVTDHTQLESCDDSTKSPKDEELNHLPSSLNISSHGLPSIASNKEIILHESYQGYQSGQNTSPSPPSRQVTDSKSERFLRPKILWMLATALVFVLCMFTFLPLGKTLVGPAPKPIGSYDIFEVQVSHEASSSIVMYVCVCNYSSICVKVLTTVSTFVSFSGRGSFLGLLRFLRRA